MQRLNIEAARKHAGQSDLVTPSGPPTSGVGGGGGGGGSGNGGGVTPISLNTPDILNSILNINPFFDPPTASTTISNLGTSTYTSSCAGLGDHLAGTPEDHEKKVFATLETPGGLNLPGLSSSSNLVTSAHGASSSLTLPSLLVPPPSTQPPSVELTRSKLIKESLKHSIQSKRKNSGKGELDVRAELVVKQRKREELTPEDEERRRRRRERNKIAATKCRNKKKEKTSLLIKVCTAESESLEGNNIHLKSEISKLEMEHQQLMEALNAHAPLCSRVLGSSSNLSSDNRGGTSGGGGGSGGGSGTGSRNLASSHSMLAPQFSTGHHSYSSSGHIHGGGLPHHHHSSYYNNASIQLS
ncbi:unnamed protein product [Orchesella dallaii]|uniref:BZIP domain-containing protein n=1 Tax=Orchesella dallaii TaxID=48710 RepID=A0ABP1QSQ4_9HEXA